VKKRIANYNKMIDIGTRNPLVSIIVPVYNVKEHLRQCIDSILNQSYKNIEIILVDDGTPDESSIICEEYLQKYDQIVIVHKDNDGAGPARNAGMDIVRGEYFTFMDSDDYIHKDYILLMLALAIKTGSDIACNRIKITNSKKEDTENRPKEFSYYILDGKTATTTFDYKVALYGKIYKTEKTCNIRLGRQRVQEDDDSYYRFAYPLDRICIADIFTYYYYQSENSLIRDGNTDKSLIYIDVYENRVKYFEQRNEPVLVDNTYYRLCLIIILNYFSYKKNKTNEGDYEYLLKVFNDSFDKIKHSKNIGFIKKLAFGIFGRIPNLITFIVILLHIR